MAETKRVNLALQGGGSHGAFTWGVLDRLLEDGRLEFEGISGTSAGAMNAAVLAQGLHEGGREAAREALAAFWEEIGTYAPFSPVRTTPLDQMAGNWNLDRSPGAAIIEMAQRLAPPALRNPLRLNSLATVLRNRLRTDAVQACKHVKLFVAATNVETGVADLPQRRDQPRCPARLGLPAQPVRGGDDRRSALLGRRLHGQPGDLAFIYECESRDVVLVQINPDPRRRAQDAGGDRQPAQRDHLQRRADRRDARHRLRPEADRGRRCLGPRHRPPQAHAGPHRHRRGGDVAAGRGQQVQRRAAVPALPARRRPRRRRTLAGGDVRRPGNKSSVDIRAAFL